jgi:NAD(P)-dependent dehydrogenase (short-subunit alcohol dehydrogenase family)
MELANKVCVVTGGASGIGAACCRAFAAHGARVVVADRVEPGARAVADEIGGLAVHCDVGREADVHELVARTTQHYGPVDVFFSNAGIASGSDPLRTPLDVWQDQWQVNLMAHVYAIREVLPSMLERGSGYLLHTASMAGILTTHGNLPYAVTKHGVVGLAEWLSITYHDRGIRTSLLAPLGVRTGMMRGAPKSSFGNRELSRQVLGPIREPEEVAQMVIDAMREERFLILTDPTAQRWMDGKAQDLERWLRGMRRLQGQLDAARSSRAKEGGSYDDAS